MQKRITLILISILIVVSISYAFFVSNESINTNLNYNISFEDDSMFRAYTKENGYSSIVTNFNISSADMIRSTDNKAVYQNTDTFVIELNTANKGPYECTFDYVWKWDSNSDSYTISAVGVKEFTISGPFNETNVPNSTTNTLILGSGSIEAEGNSSNTMEVPITTKFYNLKDTDQAGHAGKNYKGSVVVDNVSCYSTGAADIIAALANTEGAGAAGGHPGAMVNAASDHGTRYVGENPSNFVWFNCSSLTNQNAETCERWRIIGVFNEKYDTNNDGKPDTEGNLVKIIRNDSLGNYSWDYKQSGVGSSTTDYGSNDWSDSGLMMMLNPTTFVNSGYVNESDTTAVHSNTINNGYVVSGGINIYRNMGSYFDSSLTAYSPASTTTSGWSSTTEAPSTFVRMNPISQPMIATVKWYVTGTSNYDTSTASMFYNSEHNIDSAGNVLNASRPKIWYGKVGLMYPSDYGYATSGNAGVTGYDRASCLNKELYNWNSGSYKTYCAKNDWLLYAGATGNTSATKGTATDQWTITPHSSGAFHVFIVFSTGYVYDYYALYAYGVRPVLSLEAGVSISEGTGTYSDPYSLQMN